MLWLLRAWPESRLQRVQYAGFSCEPFISFYVVILWPLIKMILSNSLAVIHVFFFPFRKEKNTPLFGNAFWRMKGKFFLQVRLGQLWLARSGKAGVNFLRHMLWEPRAVGLGPFWDEGAIFEFFPLCIFPVPFWTTLYIHKHFHRRTMYSGSNFVHADFTWFSVFVLEQCVQSFPFMFCTLLNLSVCELKICLLLCLKFSIVKEELMSHIRHNICT